MRARVLVAAGLVSAVLGACSKPDVETGLAQDDRLAADLELALTGAGGAATEVAVASEIEAPRPKPEAKRPPRKPTVAPPTPDVAVPVPEPDPEPESAQVAEPVSEPTFTLSPLLRTPAEVVPEGNTVARSGPADGNGGAEEDELRGGRTVEGRSPGNGRGPIIIRGGVTERDPCAIHMPGRGGVLINDRLPRLGGGNGGVGNPTFPGRGYPGGGGGGGIFRIR